LNEEKKSLSQNLKKWEGLTKKGISISERVKETEIQDYINVALEKISHFRT
jgi:GTP cyclohydrolase II